MTQGIESIITLVTAKLENRGFTVMREFSAVDSLVHADKMLGVISIDEFRTVAQAFDNTDMSLCTEVDYALCRHR